VKRVTILLAACAAAALIVGGAAAIELIGSYATPGSHPRGYAFSDLYAGWLVDDGAGVIYHMHWTTGSVSASFAAPGGRGAWGLCTALGRNLILSNNRTSYIYRMTTTGSVMGSCRCPLDGPADMTWAYPGNYARFVTIEGKRYSHIIDPRTGWPADGVPSVTVVSASTMTADIWATALSVLGPEGLALLPEETGALIVTGSGEDYQLIFTPGFREML